MKDPSDRAASDDELTSEEVPHSQGKPRQAPPLPNPDVLELLESEEESMIHRLDFGLQTHTGSSSGPSDRAPGDSSRGRARSGDEDADLEGLDEDESGLEEQLELEDRFDWAFSRGQHFSAAPRSTEPELVASPPDLEPESPVSIESIEVNRESEPTTALRDPAAELEPSASPPASIPPSEGGSPVAQASSGALAAQPVREQSTPNFGLVASESAATKPKAPIRRQRPSGRKAGVPGWLAGSAAAFLVLAGFSIWYLMRSLDSPDIVEQDDVATLAGDLSSSDEPALPSQAPPKTEPSGAAPAGGTSDPAEQSGAEAKIVLGSGGEVVADLPIHGSKGSPAPGADAANPTGSPGAEARPAAGGELVAVAAEPRDVPKPQAAEKRDWEPLILGADLPGWQRRGTDGWSVNGNALTVRSAVKTKASTVLVTDRKFHDLALAFKVRPDSAGTTFGVLARARSAGAVRLEFSGGFATLRAGEKSVSTPWVSKPGQWQPFVLILRGADILVFADRQKLAVLSDPAPEADGRLGVYCKTGEVAFESLKVQTLD